MTETEPPLRLVTPDGRWAIEVTQQEDGQFCVLVILDGETTTDSLFTNDSDRVITWAARQMREAMRRSGKDELCGQDPKES
jgi:hypothetical protein